MLGLIGIGNRESGDGFVELVTVAEVPADHRWLLLC